MLMLLANPLRNAMVGLLRLGSAQVFVGAAAIFARFALTGAGPLAVSYLRLAIAAAIVVALSFVRGGRARLGTRRELLLALAGAALALHFAGWIASLEFTSVAIATVLVCTSPIFTGIYDAFAMRRFPGTFFWGALALGALGLALVVAAKSAPAPIPGHAALGAALALAGAIAMGFYLTLVRSVRAELGTLAIVSRTYAWAALLLVPCAALAQQPPPPLANGVAWGGIVAMALVSQLLGHTTMNAALRDFTPTTVGFSTLLEPLIAALLAALVFGESVGGATVAGGILLLAAVGLAIRAQAAAVDTEL